MAGNLDEIHAALKKIYPPTTVMTAASYPLHTTDTVGFVATAGTLYYPTYLQQEINFDPYVPIKKKPGVKTPTAAGLKTMLKKLSKEAKLKLLQECYMLPPGDEKHGWTAGVIVKALEDMLDP